MRTAVWALVAVAATALGSPAASTGVKPRAALKAAAAATLRIPSRGSPAMALRVPPGWTIEQPYPVEWRLRRADTEISISVFELPESSDSSLDQVAQTFVQGGMPWSFVRLAVSSENAESIDGVEGIAFNGRDNQNRVVYAWIGRLDKDQFATLTYTTNLARVTLADAEPIAAVTKTIRFIGAKKPMTTARSDSATRPRAVNSASATHLGQAGTSADSATQVQRVPETGSPAITIDLPAGWKTKRADANTLDIDSPHGVWRLELAESANFPSDVAEIAQKLVDVIAHSGGVPLQKVGAYKVDGVEGVSYVGSNAKTGVRIQTWFGLLDAHHLAALTDGGIANGNLADDEWPLLLKAVRFTGVASVALSQRDSGRGQTEPAGPTIERECRKGALADETAALAAKDHAAFARAHAAFAACEMRATQVAARNVRRRAEAEATDSPGPSSASGETTAASPRVDVPDWETSWGPAYLPIGRGADNTMVLYVGLSADDIDETAQIGGWLYIPVVTYSEYLNGWKRSPQGWYYHSYRQVYEVDCSHRTMRIYEAKGWSGLHMTGQSNVFTNVPTAWQPASNETTDRRIFRYACGEFPDGSK